MSNPALKSFLLKQSHESLIDLALNLSRAAWTAEDEIATLKQEVAALSAATKIAANRSDCDILSELEDGEIISYVAECLPNYMVEALPHVAAMTAEFEEKYYGLDLTNRRLRDTLAKLEERFAKVTMSLAQAEAALGIYEPVNDEWDSWADAAIKTLD